MAVSVLVVYPHDGVSDWELQLAATAQHPERVSYCLLLVQEKIEIPMDSCYSMCITSIPL